MTQDAESQQRGDWLVEQRCRAVLEVLDGSPIAEVAQRNGVSRQSVYTWKAKYAAGGFEGLREASRRPRTSPTRLPAEVEALVCEMRRSHPRWGARRIAYEIERAGTESAPSRATVHRVLARNGLVRPQEQQHRRKYKRWQRETPMHLWQLDLVGGIYLADGRECKMLTGIDDHSRFIVVSEVLAVPSGRAVADAFVRAMRVHGVPAEVLTDNGKQFTGRYTRPRPAEVLFERVCRENGIGAKLTKPYSPTTTGKVERWHRTLRRELLDDCGPFTSLAAAQAAISEWVHTYNHLRPHQALDMATPASLFRPNPQPEPVKVMPAQRSETVPAPAESAPPTLVLEPSVGAVEFDTVLPASGQVSIIPSVQRIRLGAGRAEGPADRGNPVDRGKSGSELHVLSEAQGIPVVVGVSAANTNDILALKPLVRGIPAVRSRRGPRRRRPGKLRGDKAYHSAATRTWLRERGIAVRIARPGIESSERLGRHRWKIERSIAWLFGYRRLTVRYERKGSHFLAFLGLAAALTCYKKLAKLTT